ncbi:MAG: Aerobic carbon monoxide dehydrogenase (quinone), large chain, partial [uncultured Thermomicrobiales bacterium]
GSQQHGWGAGAPQGRPPPDHRLLDLRRRSAPAGDGLRRLRPQPLRPRDHRRHRPRPGPGDAGRPRGLHRRRHAADAQERPRAPRRRGRERDRPARQRAGIRRDPDPGESPPGAGQGPFRRPGRRRRRRRHRRRGGGRGRSGGRVLWAVGRRDRPLRRARRRRTPALRRGQGQRFRPRDRPDRRHRRRLRRRPGHRQGPHPLPARCPLGDGAARRGRDVGPDNPRDDRLEQHPGAALESQRHRRSPRPEPEPGPLHRAGGRWRLRGQDRHLPRGPGRARDRDGPQPPRQMDRDPERELSRHQPRPQPVGRHRGRRRRRRHPARRPRPGGPRLRGLPQGAGSGLVHDDHVDRLLQRAEPGLPGGRRLHQHDGERRVSGRRSPRGRLLHRAGDGFGRRRGRTGPGRRAAEKLPSPRAVPLRHPLRRALRHRRVRQGADQGGGRGRLRRPPPGAGRGADAGPLPRDRPRLLRRDLRVWAVREFDGAGRAEWGGDHLHRHLAPRPGPGDDVRPTGDRAHRRRFRPGGGPPRRHRQHPAGQRHDGQPRPGRRRRRPDALPGQDPGQGEADRRPHPGGRRRGHRDREREVPGPRRAGPGRRPGGDRQTGLRGRHPGRDRQRPGSGRVLQARRRDLSVRYPRRRGRGVSGDGRDQDPALRLGRRLRHDHQPDAGHGPGPRRSRPGHRPGPVRGDALRRRRRADHRHPQRLRAAQGLPLPQLRDPPHRNHHPLEPARREGHRRGRHHRLHPRHRQRRDRRPGTLRRHPPRHPLHPRKGLAGDQRREGDGGNGGGL